MFKFILPSLFFLCLSNIIQETQAEDWPQWRGPQRNGTWQETGLVSQFPQKQLPRMWEVEIGSGYSGPTVANGRVYVMDRLTKPDQVERVLCFDADNGKLIWEHKYPCRYTISYTAGPRASVTIDDGLAYAVGAMGNFSCLNAESGESVWQIDLNQEYRLNENDRMPIWGQTCSPLVYEKLVIVQAGAEDASVIAFDKKSGKEVWRALSDRGQYSSPVITQQAGHDVLVCWTGASVAGLDPASGKVHWQVAFPVSRMPIGCASPVIDGNRAFFTSFYDGSLMLELSQQELSARQVWKEVGPSEKETKALHSIISTPIILGDYIYGVDSYGELRCLDAKTGARIWEDLTAVPRARWSTIHFVKNDDNVWMFNERGELLITRVSPQGFEEISRASVIEPTTAQLGERGGVCWSHPAFAMRSIFARNDQKLVRVDLAEKE
jgi:outer membrane protein assembly factor BamB